MNSLVRMLVLFSLLSATVTAQDWTNTHAAPAGGMTARIAYSLPAGETISLFVTDAAGKTVAELASGYKEAGRHETAFEPASLPAGSYFYVLKGGTSQAVWKLAVVR